MDILLRPIGYVSHNFDDDVVSNSINGVEGYVVLLPEYVDGLEGLDGFSHIILIAYLHKVGDRAKGVLKVKPRGFTRKLRLDIDEVPLVGVFATDSPYRPNPIALSIVRLIDRKGNVLHVDNLDLYNETPILDIKPYTYARMVKNLNVPQWYRELLDKARGINPGIVDL
ncbi:MAG: tRNA (N6-threonylcarbamoyladenosine(37)-N6)-methyltransferase TrmO [Ignisphaera sp.]